MGGLLREVSLCCKISKISSYRLMVNSSKGFFEWLYSGGGLIYRRA